MQITKNIIALLLATMAILNHQSLMAQTVEMPPPETITPSANTVTIKYRGDSFMPLYFKVMYEDRVIWESTNGVSSSNTDFEAPANLAYLFLDGVTKGDYRVSAAPLSDSFVADAEFCEVGVFGCGVLPAVLLPIIAGAE